MRPPHIPQPIIDPTAVVAPSAHIYGDVSIGANSLILLGVAIRAELDRVAIGDETNLQDNVVVHCDEDAPCLIGDRVTVGHAAVVHGATLGNRSLIGIGAIALNNSRVGEGALLAAGSVLTEGSELPAWTLGMGIPARPVRELTDKEIKRNDDGVEHYLLLCSRYREIFSNSRQ